MKVTPSVGQILSGSRGSALAFNLLEEFIVRNKPGFGRGSLKGFL